MEMALELFIVRQAVVLIASAIAAYTDHKTGFIYDKITYPLIAIGLLLNLVEQNWFGIGLGTLVFAIGYAFYWFGKVGGGDVKLFAGISLVLPFSGNYPFVLLVLFAAALSSVAVVSIQYVGAYARKGIDWKENREGIGKALLFGAVFCAYFYLLWMQSMISLQGIALLGVPLLLGLVFFALEKGIRKNFFLKQVPVSALEEDELVAKEFMEKSVVEQLGLNQKGILDKGAIEQLKSLRIATVPVYQGLPKFGPFILAGVIITLWFPNYLSYLFTIA